MHTPFPGMDPYLEHPVCWPNVHNGLVVAIRNNLGPKLRPKYMVCTEERTYLAATEDSFVGRPDVNVSRVREVPTATTTEAPGPNSSAVLVEVPVPDTIRETWLEIRLAPQGEVVTVIEVLSPSNKARSGNGRRIYEEERMEVLGTKTHLVEIDLIRSGEPMPVRGAGQPTDYRILVSRSGRRPKAELFPFRVRDPIPVISIPLLRGDPEPVLDLRALLEADYEVAGYDLRIDYKSDPTPPLREEDARWADGLLLDVGHRKR